MKFDLLLYAVTDRSWEGEQTLAEQLEAALEAGVTLVQLREKDMDDGAFLDEARQIKALTDRYQVPLIINDNIQVALDCGAAGVHIGQSDLDVGQARQLLGPDKILGVTAKTAEQAVYAWRHGADYLGAGAVFGSQTKTDAGVMSKETLQTITAAVPIPVVAIGGINETNLLELKNTGIAGAAIVSGIFAAADIGSAVIRLREYAEQATGKRGGEG